MTQGRAVRISTPRSAPHLYFYEVHLSKIGLRLDGPQGIIRRSIYMRFEKTSLQPFKIRDGIPFEHRARIFDPFYTTREILVKVPASGYPSPTPSVDDTVVTQVRPG